MSRFACLLPALAGLFVAVPASALGHSDLGAVLAELSTTRPIYGPNDEVRVRFSLINSGPDSVDIPLAEAPPEGLVLPDELLFGFRDEPRLFLAVGGDRSSAVQPNPAAPPASATEHVLRLAPGAIIGAEVNLRKLDRVARYSGAHELVWRPFGPDHGEARVRYRVESRKQAVIVTDYGKITADLFYDAAPRNVANFLDLARSRFYDGLTFHRVIPGFIVQGGAPDGQSGSGRPDGQTVPAEFTSTPVVAGSLLMARLPSDPDSASCQFFIALDRVPDLDGEYTIVGQARDDESLRTLQRLEQIATDSDGRPLRPLVIRFITLIDAPGARGESMRINP